MVKPGAGGRPRRDVRRRRHTPAVALVAESTSRSHHSTSAARRVPETVAAGSAFTYASQGGFAPYLWQIDYDSTCANNGTRCSTLNETTGAFVAGTGQAGYVLVAAIDADGAETFSEITVGAPTGRPRGRATRGIIADRVPASVRRWCRRSRRCSGRRSRRIVLAPHDVPRGRQLRHHQQRLRRNRHVRTCLHRARDVRRRRHGQRLWLHPHRHLVPRRRQLRHRSPTAAAAPSPADLPAPRPRPAAEAAPPTSAAARRSPTVPRRRQLRHRPRRLRRHRHLRPPAPRPQTCGGGGTANVCGCTPKSPPAPPATTAAPSPTAAAAPSPAAACTAPQTCGGGGNANVCGCTPPSPPAPPATTAAPSPTAAAAPSRCGTCSGGAVCSANVCVGGGMDAGIDSGVIDSGSSVDSGSSIDSGTTIDSGIHDSGTVVDSGTPRDSGTIVDAATDSGTTADSGAATDSGSVADSSSPQDSSTTTDSAGPENDGAAQDAPADATNGGFVEGGGCSCRTAARRCAWRVEPGFARRSRASGRRRRAAASTTLEESDPCADAQVLRDAARHPAPSAPDMVAPDLLDGGCVHGQRGSRPACEASQPRRSGRRRGRRRSRRRLIWMSLSAVAVAGASSRLWFACAPAPFRSRPASAPSRPPGRRGPRGARHGARRGRDDGPGRAPRSAGASPPCWSTTTTTSRRGRSWRASIARRCSAQQAQVLASLAAARSSLEQAKTDRDHTARDFARVDQLHKDGALSGRGVRQLARPRAPGRAARLRGRGEPGRRRRPRTTSRAPTSTTRSSSRPSTAS